MGNKETQLLHTLEYYKCSHYHWNKDGAEVRSLPSMFNGCFDKNVQNACVRGKEADIIFVIFF